MREKPFIRKYTKITDKKGKKIYEGDIVRHTQMYLSGEVISTGFVKWSESWDCWIIAGYTNGRCDMFLSSERYRIEKIGNIYDNPELISQS